MRIRSILALVSAAAIIPACSNDSDDGAPGYAPPSATELALSVFGPDRFLAATAGPSGSFYVAGYTAADPNAAKYVAVLKLSSTGALDAAFGGDGLVVTNVVTRGNPDEIDIATQNDGKIIVSTTVPDADDATDNDVAVFRLETDGDLDTTFATSGVRVVDLSTKTADSNRDAVRGLAVNASNNLIYLHCAQKADGRDDTDFAVVRLTADGDVDTSFDTDGKQILDIDNQDATVRSVKVLSDGKIIASGYAKNTTVAGPSPPNGPQAVVYKLLDTGAFDTAFDTDGVFHAKVLDVQTEVYDFALHGGNMVTGGYGRESGTINVWISLRFDTTTGVRDPAWGGATKGAVLVAPSALTSNCRSAVALPGGKTLLLGSTGSGVPGQDAAFAVLDADGTLDPDYGAKAHVTALGLNLADNWWAGAVSGDKMLLVGWSEASSQTLATNDDSFFLLVPLE